VYSKKPEFSSKFKAVPWLRRLVNESHKKSTNLITQHCKWDLWWTQRNTRGFSPSNCVYPRQAHSANLPKIFIHSLNAELNPICYLLALLGAHHILHVSRIRFNIFQFRHKRLYTDSTDK